MLRPTVSSSKRPRSRVAGSLMLCLTASYLLTTACEGSSEPDTQDKSAEQDDDADEGSSSLSGMGPLAKMFASGLTEPGPYDEPRESEGFDENEPHLLVLELDGPIAEVETISLLGTDAGKPLQSLQLEIDAAIANENVEGIVVRAADFSLDMALAQELRASLQRLRDAGKSLRCHAENVGNAAYHVMTACEKIGLSPLGDVSITGAAATPIHVKGLLDRIGVTADFLHVGDYKGAAEPITRESPSPAMIETLEALLDDVYAASVQGIVDGRGLSEDEAKAAIDKALYVGEQAVTARLVDEVIPWEEFLAASGKDWTKGSQAENPLEDFSGLQRFVGLLPPERPREPHVALVYAVGNVIDGKGSGIVGARQEIASRTLVAALRALAKDNNVKSVVLRISSGGGSARASELIWHAVEELKKSKPVVVSMGGVAASGGYYIAAGATKIFADPTTITGSIGVVGGKIVVGDALAKIGVTNFEVKRGERALMWSAMRPWTEPERAAVQDMMEVTYDAFVGRVAAGRSMERSAVHEIAQGRVWTGAAAKDKGLVDELGGLHAALAEARTLGGVGNDVELEVYPGKPTLRDLLSSFDAVSVGSIMGSPAVTDSLTQIAALGGPEVAARTHAILRMLISQRKTKLWTMSWLPPL